MNEVTIGGISLSQIGLGTFPLKGESLHQALLNAVNRGYRLIDTAYKYHNESDIGDFMLQHDRPDSSIVVQTKFSATQLTYKKFLWLKYGNTTIDDAINGSIGRLKRKILDVYLLHSPSNGYSDFFGELLRFRRDGKAKVVGVCKFDEQQLWDIRNKCGEFPTINQIEVHPFNSNKRLIGFCKEHGIVVEARSLFAHGDALNELTQSDILQKIAKDYRKSVPQVIIRWVIQQGLIAIVKSGMPDHIRDNSEVFDFCLTEKEMSLIDTMNRNQSFGYVSQSFKNH